MKFAFKPVDADWIEISADGVILPGGGESGEDVRLSRAFVESLPPETRVERGFIEVDEPAPPEHWIGWTIGDVDGVPTVIWQTED